MFSDDLYRSVSLKARAAFHESFCNLLRGHFLADELQQGLGDGHVDLVFHSSVKHFFDGADTFGNMADFHQHLMQFFAFYQTQTDTAVARKCAGTGQDKVEIGRAHV